MTFLQRDSLAPTGEGRVRRENGQARGEAGHEKEKEEKELRLAPWYLAW